VEQVLAARQCDGVAGQGKTHVVRMVGDDRGYRFEPASLTIDANDAVRFEFVSGGPHNVAFDSATLSPAARAALARGMENPVMELASQMLLQPGGSVTVRFAGVPSGTYQFHCMPHLAMDHRGSITVRWGGVRSQCQHVEDHMDTIEFATFAALALGALFSVLAMVVFRVRGLLAQQRQTAQHLEALRRDFVVLRQNLANLKERVSPLLPPDVVVEVPHDDKDWWFKRGCGSVMGEVD